VLLDPEAEMQGLTMTARRLIKRYLLGTASADEKTALESKYLSDAEVFEEITAAENDLIDSYIRNQLSDAEKGEFEKRYMASPKGRMRADFSRALAEVSLESRRTTELGAVSVWETLRSFPSRLPVFRWGIVASCAVIVALVIGSTYFVRSPDLQAGLWHRQTQTQQTGPPQTAPMPSSASGGTKIAKVETPPLNEFKIRLDPGVARTIGSATPIAFVAPSATRWLNLQLVFEDDKGASYSAVLETPEGREVDRIRALKSQSASGRATVAVRLPVRLVPAGDYVLELKAGNDLGEPIESYSFRILYK
jgi:hypothetical protein